MKGQHKFSQRLHLIRAPELELRFFGGQECLQREEPLHLPWTGQLLQRYEGVCPKPILPLGVHIWICEFSVEKKAGLKGNQKADYSFGGPVKKTPTLVHVQSWPRLSLDFQVAPNVHRSKGPVF